MEENERITNIEGMEGKMFPLFSYKFILQQTPPVMGILASIK
jgi:hypothetical protein